MRNKAKTNVNKEQWEYNLDVIHSRIKDLIEIAEEYKISLQQVGTGGLLTGLSMSSMSELKENSTSSVQTFPLPAIQ